MSTWMLTCSCCPVQGGWWWVFVSWARRVAVGVCAPEQGGDGGCLCHWFCAFSISWTALTRHFGLLWAGCGLQRTHRDKPKRHNEQGVQHNWSESVSCNWGKKHFYFNVLLACSSTPLFTVKIICRNERIISLFIHSFMFWFNLRTS